MRLFRCNKSRFRPEADSVIFVDVDGTLISSSDDDLNTGLFEALQGQTIVLLTSMSMREVQEKVTNPAYITRKSLIEHLKARYNITVAQVITTIDLDPRLSPGEGYDQYIKVWSEAAEKGELNEENLATHQGYAQACTEFTAKFTAVNEEIRNIDPKGLLVKKFFRQPENQSIKHVYFLDDKPECIDSVARACIDLYKPHLTHQVNMRDDLQAKEFYVRILNEELNYYVVEAPKQTSLLNGLKTVAL